jgi:hypothetical protein
MCWLVHQFYLTCSFFLDRNNKGSDIHSIHSIQCLLHQLIRVISVSMTVWIICSSYMDSAVQYMCVYCNISVQLFIKSLLHGKNQTSSVIFFSEKTQSTFAFEGRVLVTILLGGTAYYWKGRVCFKIILAEDYLCVLLLLGENTKAWYLGVGVPYICIAFIILTYRKRFIVLYKQNLQVVICKCNHDLMLCIKVFQSICYL